MLFVIIAASVFVVVVGLISYFVTKDKKQPTYFTSNEVKLLEFDSSTGPVSPEYQESKTLILTPTTCSFSLTKIQPQSTTITNCAMNDTIWNALVAAFDSNNVKKFLEAAPQSASLIGGPQNQFTVVYANGDTYRAYIDTAAKNELRNFLQQVQSQVPDMANISF